MTGRGDPRRDRAAAGAGRLEPGLEQAGHPAPVPRARGRLPHPHLLDGGELVPAPGRALHRPDRPGAHRASPSTTTCASSRSSPTRSWFFNSVTQSLGFAALTRRALHDGRLRAGQVPLPRQQRHLLRRARLADDPLQPAHRVALLHHHPAGAQGDLLGRHHPARGEPHRALLHARLLHERQRRDDRLGAGGRRQRVPHLLEHRAAQPAARPGHALHPVRAGVLEQPALAAHRVPEEGELPARGRAGRHGQHSTRSSTTCCWPDRHWRPCPIIVLFFLLRRQFMEGASFTGTGVQ